MSSAAPPVTILTCKQRSDEWRQMRVGRLTGSNVGDAFAMTKSGFAASRRNLRTRLMLERLTGRSQESGYTNAAMERGIELEPHAISAYEVKTGDLVQPVGFITHDEVLTGTSPDGFVGTLGMIEVKCPNAATHLDYLRGNIPNDYRLQMYHGLWLSGRAWCDFVSYSPDYPEGLQLHVQRVFADDVLLSAHELAVRLFLGEVDQELADVMAMLKERTA